VHNSNSPSSRRTQVASSAFWVNWNESTRHSAKYRRELNANKKKRTQLHLLKDVKICSIALEKVKLLNLDYIKKNVVVCNGGNNESNGIQIDQILKVLAVFESVTAIFGLLIQNVHQLACAIFCQAFFPPHSSVFQEMSHLP
jgi:hypothetical protein